MYKSFYVLLFIFSLISPIVYSGRVKRIIGGYELQCGSQPRVSSLRNATTLSHYCGATLISTRAAVTAAHCVSGSPTDYVLHLNNYCVDDDQQAPIATISDIYRHKLYDKRSRAHDIAILSVDLHLDDVKWLEEDILPKNMFGLSGECMIAGYGIKKQQSNETSDKLLAAKVIIVSLDLCHERLGPYMAPPPNAGMMCAVGIDCADSCQGDSGGPLLCSNDSILEGLSSYGQSCGAPGVPGVYTSIAPHVSWIKDTLNEIEKTYTN